MTVVKKLEDYRPIAEIFDCFHEEEDIVILESSLVNELGRYSILGRKPYKKIEKWKDRVKIDGVEKEVEFDSYVKDYLRRNREENKTKLPLIAGAVGYFSYDYNRHKEGEIPESVLIFYDQFLIEDHEEHCLYLALHQKTQTQQEALLEYQDVLRGKKQQEIEKAPGRLSFDFTKDEYEQAIENMIWHIVEGDVYIANMTQRMYIESTQNPYRLYEFLRKYNPAPFAAFCNYKDFQVVCASPERFLQVREGRIVTRPIKGTRKRGETKEEDREMKQELAHSKKDKSELLMIVDLERNDLNRICEPGSVQVTSLFAIESYATVHHLVAQVEGRLKQETDVIEIMKHVFPGGSITGAPKQRAMEVIEQEEHSLRGLYTGSIGYISLNGDCDFNIVIRTAVYQNGVYTIGVGGGITCESDKEMEYEETLQKGRAFQEAFSIKEWSDYDKE